MNELITILNTSDRVSQTETNFEKLDESQAFALNPTKIGVPLVPNTLVGPPVAGEYYEGKKWVDSLCAVFRCTVAGTPGTWQQIEPAFVATADRPVTPVDGYWIRDTDEHNKEYYWDEGGAAWTAV